MLSPDDAALLQDLLGALADGFAGEGRPGGDAAAAALRAADPAAYRRMPSASQPVALLYAACALPDAMPAAGLVAACCPLIDWTPWEGEGLEAEVSARLHSAELLGPDGHIPAVDVRVGLLLSEPATDYPVSSHSGEETYLVLAGTAQWTVGGSPYTAHAPGTLIHHPAWEKHGRRTSVEPFLGAWRWSGDLDSLQLSSGVTGFSGASPLSDAARCAKLFAENKRKGGDWMALLGQTRIGTHEDLERFQATRTLDERLPEHSILDVFAESAAKRGDATAITMLMTGAPDEEPRRVSYNQLLGLIRRAANLFTDLGGPAPGVAYMLPSLVETHVTLWGAETAGYAVPINFLLQPDSIAELLKASGVRILVALGPHPQLDLWEKAAAAARPAARHNPRPRITARHPARGWRGRFWRRPHGTAGGSPDLWRSARRR